MCLNFVEKLFSKICIKDEGKWFKFYVLEIYIYKYMICLWNCYVLNYGSVFYMY